MDLKEYRKKIDAIDDEVLELLNKRMEYVKAIGELKHKSGSPIYRPEREKEILDRLKSTRRRFLNDAAIDAIYLEIFAVSRNLELPERVAYLGPEGSFTHQVAESRFGAMSEYLSMNTILSVIKTVEGRRAKYGVLPIENNLDGVVSETLDALGDSNLKIVAEIFMPIHHTFATQCDSLKDIQKIYSKDVAFGQCKNFLSEYNLENVERIPVESTAKAAKLALEMPNSAAICSHIAAKLYKIPILFENIEDSDDNKTRFIVVSDFANQKSGNDKTSIFAKLRNSDKPGALVSFLEDFYEANINLTKIESRPALDSKDFSFWFFIDFDGHIDDANVQKALSTTSAEIKWLGSYMKGE